MKKRNRKSVLRQGPASTQAPKLVQVDTLISLHAQEVEEKARKIQESLRAAEEELAAVRRILGEIV